MSDNNNNKDVQQIDYYIWNDEPVAVDYIDNITLPNGKIKRDVLGKVNIEKGDAIYVDHGASILEHTRSGKGPTMQYPFGQIQMQGVTTSITLKKYHDFKSVRTSLAELDILVKKQQERIKEFIPALKEKYTMAHIEKIENKTIENEQKEIKNSEMINKALLQMEGFFTKNKL